MFENIPLEPAVIRTAVPDGSGNIVRTPFEARAVLLRQTEELQPETSGIVKDQKTFLIFAEKAPAPGDLFCWHETEFEIRTVYTIRSLAGKTIAYRCVC